MTIYAVADVHIANHRAHGGPVIGGLNNRATQLIKLLRDAFAQTTPGDHFVVLGDLFDHHAPIPALLRATQEALTEPGCGHPWVIPGNHDQSSDKVWDNACSPLWVADCVEQPRIIVDGNTAALMVPFGAPVYEVLRDALRDVENTRMFTAWKHAEYRLLLGHFGISDPNDPPFMRDARDAIDWDTLAELCLEQNVQAVGAGNWHLQKFFRKEVDGRSVEGIQTGALAPTGWDNPGWRGYGGLVHWDSETGTWETMSCNGPRFIRHTPTEEELHTYRNCSIYARVDAPPSEVEEKRAELEALPLAGYEIRTVDPAAQKAAEDAAAAVRTVELLGEALGRYVSEMPLPEGVTRQELLAAAKSYLPGV